MISIITLYYNESDFINAYLDSFEEVRGIDYEIIIFNNFFSHASNNTLKKALKRCSPALKKKITLIQASKNYGFAKAVNKASKKAKMPLLMFLNPDTVITQVVLDQLILVSKSSPNAVVGGRFAQYKNDTNVQKTAVENSDYLSCLFELTSMGKLFPFFSKQFIFWTKHSSGTHSVSGVSGGIMLISRSLFDSLGKFDENYFFYLEDLDLCIRARKRGVDILFCADAAIEHYGGGSSTAPNRSHARYWTRSRDYFFKRNFSLLQYVLYKCIASVESLYITTFRRI